MNCYRHHNRSAIAVCKNCGKTACSECCDDTGQGIACCPACTEELQQTYRLKERLKRNFGIGSKLPLPAAVPMYALFALILLGVGIFLSYTRSGIRQNYVPGLCIYKFLYVWMDLHLDGGQKVRNLGWKYWLPNPLLPFIWFRVALPRAHPAIAIEEF